jgi:hypothetical protein
MSVGAPATSPSAPHAATSAAPNTSKNAVLNGTRFPTRCDVRGYAFTDHQRSVECFIDLPPVSRVQLPIVLPSRDTKSGVLLRHRGRAPLSCTPGGGGARRRTASLSTTVRAMPQSLYRPVRSPRQQRWVKALAAAHSAIARGGDGMKAAYGHCLRHCIVDHLERVAIVHGQRLTVGFTRSVELPSA